MDKWILMRIISKRILRGYWKHHHQAELPLTEWYLKMKVCCSENLTQLRKIFNSADVVKGYTIFNIGGNNYRLITAIHYNRQLCYVRGVWTHAEYSKNANQEKLRENLL